MSEVSFDPGDVDAFADYLQSLLDRLEPRHADFVAMRNDGGALDLGDFEDVDWFIEAHQHQVEATTEAVHTLYRQIEALRDAAREISEGYRSAEEVNEALSRAMEHYLGDVTTGSGAGVPQGPPVPQGPSVGGPPPSYQ